MTVVAGPTISSAVESGAVQNWRIMTRLYRPVTLESKNGSLAIEAIEPQTSSGAAQSLGSSGGGKSLTSDVCRFTCAISRPTSGSFEGTVCDDTEGFYDRD